MLLLFSAGCFIFIASGKEQIYQLMRSTWKQLGSEGKNNLQEKFSCCGFENRFDLPGTNCQDEWESGCKHQFTDYFQSMNRFFMTSLVSVFLFLVIRERKKKKKRERKRTVAKI